MFAKSMKLLAALFLVLTIVFAILYRYIPGGAMLSLAITFGTIAYHFWMRLAVGYAVNGICHNQVDYNKWWFREKPFEKRLYKWLKVKKWKDKMPSFTPETWDPRTHTWEEIAGAMCQSEVVHSIIVILSFVPIAATFIWGDFWVFFITSVLSAGVDSMFVIMQRYNRPRVQRLIKRRHD